MEHLQLPPWRDLAPLLCRQRVKIEANVDHLAKEVEIIDFMQKLSVIVDMHVLEAPMAYPAVIDNELVGYGGWIHWVTSGCHVYSYTKEKTQNGFDFITVDCYTCKPFQIEKAYWFTKEYFKAEEVVIREV